jgi:hypothetical protein
MGMARHPTGRPTMKLTELILQLHTIMLEKGNLDVFIDTPDGYAAPEIEYLRGCEDLYPAGVYLS